MKAMDVYEKKRRLEERLRGLGRLAVAFSGGVDSAFLLKAAREVLPADRLLAITARAAIFPGREGAEAEQLAREMGVELLVLDFPALEVPEVAANPPDRCYHCKRALFQTLTAVARERGFSQLADGSNLDDTGDYRPGSTAIVEPGVASPLTEAGLSKAEIRLLSAELGQGTWNKPAFACLASRFPYGRAIEAGALRQVEAAEDYLLSQGLRDVRVRHHGEVARLEVGRDERRRFFDLDFLDRVQAELKGLGFAYVALDLGGYRPGNLNDGLSDSDREKFRQDGKETLSPTGSNTGR